MRVTKTSAGRRVTGEEEEMAINAVRMNLPCLTTNGSRHSCCLLMAYRLSSGILQGPSRPQARDRKLSRASQSTLEISDHQGGSDSTIRTLAG